MDRFKALLITRDEATKKQSVGVTTLSRSDLMEGDVEVRSGWRAQDGTSRHFTCTMRNGRIADVYFRTDRATR